MESAILLELGGDGFGQNDGALEEVSISSNPAFLAVSDEETNYWRVGERLHVPNERVDSSGIVGCWC